LTFIAGLLCVIINYNASTAVLSNVRNNGVVAQNSCQREDAVLSSPKGVKKHGDNSSKDALYEVFLDTASFGGRIKGQHHGLIGFGYRLVE